MNARFVLLVVELIKILDTLKNKVALLKSTCTLNSTVFKM